jgi:AcrR family transcriptional regulator
VNYDSACQAIRGENAVTVTETHSPSETHRPLRADARRNRERILESARALFAENGAEAQIDDVAQHAGVGVGTVYRHFPTKEALLVELVRRQFALFAERAREALETLEDDREAFAALEDVMRSNAATTASDAAVQYAMEGAGEHIWEQAGAEKDELLALTQDLIERAVRTGKIRADAHASDVGMLMCGVCSTMGRDGPGFDWRRHLDLAIDALRPR